jgi:putative ABC transport system permease protein
MIFKIALRNVILHWRQSLAATVSLAAGLVSIVMFQGYMQDVGRMYQETFRSRMMYGDAIIENTKLTGAEGRSEPWKYGISSEDQTIISDFMKNHSIDVQSTTRFLQISGMISNGLVTSIFMGYGYDVAHGEKTRGPDWAWNTLYGVPLQEGQRQNISLGKSLGQILSCVPLEKEKIMDAVAGYIPRDRPFRCPVSQVQLNVTTASGQMNAMDFEITGLQDALYKDIDEKFVATDLTSAQILMNTQDISYFTVKTETSNVDHLIVEFQSEMDSRHKPYHMVRWEDHLVGDLYVRTMNLLGVFRNFVLTIIIAVAGLSIFNTMMKIVRERTREIGTLQSLGFIRPKILMIFISEAVILSLLGGIIGSIFAMLATLAVNALGILYKAGILVEPVPLRIMISPMLYLSSFILLSILAGLTTWSVCRSVLKKETIENLTAV